MSKLALEINEENIGLFPPFAKIKFPISFKYGAEKEYSAKK